MPPRSNRDEPHGLEGSTPSPSASATININVLLAERQMLQASNLARRVRFPQGTLMDFGTKGGQGDQRKPGFR